MNEHTVIAERPIAENIHAIEVSETLKADFALLRETPSSFLQNGSEKDSYLHSSDSHPSQNKFSSATVDLFARYIVCRNYAGLCYELAHLCWAISNSKPENALFDYFYISEAVRPSEMLAYFENTSTGDCVVPSASIKVERPNERSEKSITAGISINIHQHQFRVHATRANLLAVFMEWLVTISPKAFEHTYDALYAKGYNAIRQLSSQWQKSIYDYLKAHLPPLKMQSKFQYLKQYLQDQGSQHFCDEDILPLWQSMAEREGSERLSTVFKDICQFHEALDKARYQRAIDYHDDLEEILKLEHVHDALERHTSEQIPLDHLYQNPKLISKQQASRLQILCEFPHQSVRFPVTIIAESVLGDLQARCIQAQRNNTLVKSLIVLPDQNLYQDLINKLNAQVEVNEHGFYAVLHILFGREQDQAVELLSLNDRAINQFISQTNDANENTATQLSPQINTNRQKVLLNQLTQNKALMARCKQAFQQNNRQGFTAQTLLEDTQCYLDNTRELLRISKLLIALNQRYRALFPDVSTLMKKYRADGSIFCNELIKRML